jgi:N6-L-threonylcarbamoyladenine synthase
MAIDGNPRFVTFPRALKQKTDFNFSYSGLKTSVLTYLTDKSRDFIDTHKSDLAASIQQAIIDPLIDKSIRYAKQNGIANILLAGGVAANSALRKQINEKARRESISVFHPSLKLCMDNAAMVASAAIPKYKAGLFSPLSVNAFSTKGTKLL